MILNEWKEWKTNPQTIEWFKFLEKLREEVKEDWASNVYTGEGELETLQRNSFALGQVDLLRRLMHAEFEEVEESKSE